MEHYFWIMETSIENAFDNSSNLGLARLRGARASMLLGEIKIYYQRMLITLATNSDAHNHSALKHLTPIAA